MMLSAEPSRLTDLEKENVALKARAEVMALLLLEKDKVIAQSARTAKAERELAECRAANALRSFVHNDASPRVSHGKAIDLRACPRRRVLFLCSASSQKSHATVTTVDRGCQCAGRFSGLKKKRVPSCLADAVSFASPEEARGKGQRHRSSGVDCCIMHARQLHGGTPRAWEVNFQISLAFSSNPE